MRVILAPRCASVIALRNPEALVIDYENRCVRRGSERVSFSYGTAPTKTFRLCIALCCAAGGDVSRSDLIDLLWSDDEDGGPLRADSIISTMLCHARPFLLWAGLAVHSTKFFGRVEVRVTGVPQAQGSFRLGHGSRRPWRIAA